MLQGSNVPSASNNYKGIHPSADTDWVTLYQETYYIGDYNGTHVIAYTIRDTHNNDASIDKDFGALTSEVPNKVGAFRYLRIVQHGPNKGTNLPDWVNVLVLTGFEVFGSLYTTLKSTYHETPYADGNPGVFEDRSRKITIKASGVSQGTLVDFVSKLLKCYLPREIAQSDVHVWTTNQPYSW
jgi:hypothetical protein